MFRSFLLLNLLSLFAFSNQIFAQDSDTYQSQNNTPFEVGIEFQAYPTGIISGVNIGYGISDKASLHTRIGYNMVRHRDLGKHDDERGGGFGGTLGYRRYFKAQRTGFFIGARTGVWFNKVDWKEDPNLVSEIKGQTIVTVFQPTAELGFVIGGDQDGILFIPTIALGAEINVKTTGDPVGEGAILLLGFTIGKRF